MKKTGGIRLHGSIEGCKDFAKLKNGKCISEVYENSKQHLIWKCNLNHQWKSSFSNIKNNKRWCPTCSKNKKLDYNFVELIAKKYNAKILCKEYKNVKTKLQWQCKYGHIFWKNLNAINTRNSWCPYCYSFNSEEICRIYFENIFNTKFLKVRPDWLLNKNNNRMELDGLSQSLIDNKLLAFEHQGRQHYIKDNSKSSFFHNLDLNQMIKNDILKKEKCFEQNIILIQIPDLIRDTKLSNLKDFILKECEINNLNVSSYNFDFQMNHFQLEKNDNYFNKIKLKSLDNGGKCLDKMYLSYYSKLKFKCKNNHEFERLSNDVMQGKWCNICNANKRSVND